VALHGRSSSEGAASPASDDAPSRKPRSRTERSAIGIGILASIAVVGALYLARDFLVPLLIGILASYALGPIVDWLEARRVPRALGAALVIAILVVAMGWALYSAHYVATSMIEKLPEAAHKVREQVRDKFGGGNSAIKNIQAAAAELQGAATEAAGSQTSVKLAPKTAAPPAEEGAWLRDYMLAQSALVLQVVEHAPVVLLLIYFLLAAGEHFRRKLMKIVGPSRERKKDAVRILEEIDVQVQRYLLLTVATNVIIAIATGIVFLVLGMEQPAGWGVAAGILHFIPYLGELIFAVMSGVGAYIQLGDPMKAFVVMGTAFLVSSAIGLFLSTWLHSRLSRVNSAILFIALLFFGWLWGMWGLLLGAPLVAIAKVICDRVEWLKPAGEFMGQ
jgi:predicted PurR-regulated permease PerM